MPLHRCLPGSCALLATLRRGSLGISRRHSTQGGSCSEGSTGPEEEIHVKFHVEVAHLMKHQRICGRAVYFMTSYTHQDHRDPKRNHQPWLEGREELEANLALRCAGSIWSQPCWGPLGWSVKSPWPMGCWRGLRAFFGSKEWSPGITKRMVARELMRPKPHHWLVKMTLRRSSLEVKYIL